MKTCGGCGARALETATWCNQCFATLPADAADIPAQPAAYAPVPAFSTATAPSRFGAAYPPPAAAPPAAPPGTAPLPRGWRPPAATEPTPARAGSGSGGRLAASFAPVGLGPDLVLPDGSDGRLHGRRAVAVVVVAIALGGVMQLVDLWISHRHGIEPDTLVRLSLLLTFGFYVVVAGLVGWQLSTSVRLRWGAGPLGNRLAAGAVRGALLGGIGLALVSSASGHLAPDPRIVTLMNEGDATHIVLTVLITCVAAPLVEETLFRGLLLEALRPRGVVLAVLVSAGAFAVWHYMPAALVYYALMGIGLARRYLRGGLASSMAMHAAFNGVLAVAAVVVVLSPGHVERVGRLTITPPRGWSVATDGTHGRTAVTEPGHLLLSGPSGSELAVLEQPTAVPVDADTLARHAAADATQLPAGATLDRSSVREQVLGAGRAVTMDFSVGGYPGQLVLLPEPSEVYEFVFVGAGSPKATRDFPAMLAGLQYS